MWEMSWFSAAEETGFSLLTALEGDKTWDLDLMWECPGGFWVKNSDIDAEFSGSVNVLRIAHLSLFDPGILGLRSSLQALNPGRG